MGQGRTIIMFVGICSMLQLLIWATIKLWWVVPLAIVITGLIAWAVDWSVK